MGKYYGFPNRVKARRLKIGNQESLAQWCGGIVTGVGIGLDTPDGYRTAWHGNWIVRHRKDFYVYSNKHFKWAFNKDAPIHSMHWRY